MAQAIEDLLAGDPIAADLVNTVITDHLAWIGAYRLRDSWDDVVQEVMISLLQNPPRSRISGAIVRHIQTTTYRKYIDEVRREQGRRGNPAGGEGPDSRGWRRNVPLHEAVQLSEPEDFWEKQLDPSLRKALEGLEGRKRRVLECRYFLGCTHEEGATRLAIPLGTYRRLLDQGLSELRDALLPEAPRHEHSAAEDFQRNDD